MIDIEALVQKLDSRDGAKVVSYREVGMPLFRLPSLVTLQEAGRLGAVEEFVLRALDNGVGSSAELEQFLGLPAKIIVSQLGQLSFERAVEQIELPPEFRLPRVDC